MRALLCPRPHELTLVERPKPEVAPPSALVRLRRAGVCGAKLHIFEPSSGVVKALIEI